MVPQGRTRPAFSMRGSYQMVAVIDGSAKIGREIWLDYLRDAGVNVTDGFPARSDRAVLIVDYNELHHNKDDVAAWLLFLTQRCPSSALVLVNVGVDAAIDMDLVFHGLRGVFYEHERPRDVAAGVSRVVAGETWLSRKLIDNWLDSFRAEVHDVADVKLTNREQSIVDRVCDGASTKL